MWKILEAELKNNSIVTLWALAFWFIFFSIYLFAVNYRAQAPLIMLAMLITPMIAGYAGDFRIKEKRDRFHILLPHHKLPFGICTFNISNHNMD